MWAMRRTLFDSPTQGGAFDAAHGDLSSDSSDSPTGRSAETTVVNSVLAQLGGRHYAEELSALQESVQDLRNELAAVTTLVQQHAAVISQFVEKPTTVGRRQGGGAIKHAISASVEGPPLPDAPQLRFALATDSQGASRGTQRENQGAERETARAGESSPMGDGSGDINPNAGVLSQKSFGASVALESTLGGSEDTAVNGESRSGTANAKEAVEASLTSATGLEGGTHTTDADRALAAGRGMDPHGDGGARDDGGKATANDAYKDPVQADIHGLAADNETTAGVANGGQQGRHLGERDSAEIKEEGETLSAGGDVAADESRGASAERLKEEDEAGAGRRAFLGMGGKGLGLKGGRLKRL
ncbi:conserved hypothetical protein [Neospora caninum Liverpool]|nr:conserved hypothetical protein [Neospora caninum Liverpool]CBZ49602.1 conserved hypothetical protein [Neospora caninum Liverpool]|eukprot:XP_003879637.1 conserved hypothetical protein [Neospora caninum Liverpool]